MTSSFAGEILNSTKLCLVGGLRKGQADLTGRSKVGFYCPPFNPLPQAGGGVDTFHMLLCKVLKSNRQTPPPLRWGNSKFLPHFVGEDQGGGKKSRSAGGKEKRYFPLPSIPSHFVGGEFVGSSLHVTEGKVGCNLSYEMGFCKHSGGNKEVFFAK